MLNGKIINAFSCLLMLMLQSGLVDARAAVTTESSVIKTAANSSASTTKAPSAEERLKLAISEVDKLARQQVDNNVVPGLSIAIVHDDKIVFAKGFGVREVGKPEIVDEDTVFQLASVSKCLASTVVAVLVSEGKVDWDSQISELDPGFQLSDPWVTRDLTIRDLLSHRSGLPEHSGDLLEDIGYKRDQILNRLRWQNPESSLRSRYAYTNFPFSEGAFAAAKRSGMNWEDLCQTKLYKPLGMASTSSRYVDFTARSNKAVGHVSANGKWVHRTQRDPDAQSPAGGVSSSANDMSRWMRLQIAGGKYDGKQVVSTAALAETHHPQIFTQFSPGDGLPGFYGLGFNVSYDRTGHLHLGHSGAFAMGGATTVSMVPDARVGICVLTNAYPIGVAEGLAQSFTDVFMHGKASRDWIALFKQVFSNPAVIGIEKGFDYSKLPASPTEALSRSAYIGKYSNEYFGELQIVQIDGALHMVLGPNHLTFPLQHYDRDVFTYAAETENLTGTSGVQFTIGANGEATNVLVENLNVRGEGLFKRVATK